MNQIGNVLKEARDNKGLSLDEIQRETKIQRRYLEYIELGELDKLPGNFYAKAFVKQYCEAVGLNSSEILTEFKNEFPEDKKDLAAREMYNRAQKMNSQEDFKNKLIDNLPKFMVICFVVVAIVAAYLFLMSDSQNSDVSTTEDQDEVVFIAPEEEQEPNVNDPAEETDETDGTTGTETPADATSQQIVPVSKDGSTSIYELKNAPVGDFKVTLTATSDCWFEIKDQTGKSLYDGVVKPGTPVEVIVPAATTEIKVTVGNAVGGKVAVNGVDVVYQIPPADVTVQTIVVKPVAAAPVTPETPAQ